MSSTTAKAFPTGWRVMTSLSGRSSSPPHPFTTTWSTRGKSLSTVFQKGLQRIRGYLLSPQVVALLLEINVAQQHDLARKTDEERTLDELTAGMVLAANVSMKTGAFVMAADTELTDYGIDKLKHYHTIGAIIDKVLIRKSSVRD
jgi:hypothetical protein